MPAGMLVMLLAQPAAALDIYNYNPTNHDRFIPGTYPSSPTNNPDFFFSSLDWTGVGYQTSDPRKNVAMISPLHFIGARHFQVGGQLRFVNAGGTQKTYSVSSSNTFFDDPVTGQSSDLYLGRLTAPIPDDDLISRYGILDLDSTNDYIGLPLHVYGYRPEDGTNINNPVAAIVGTNVLDGYTEANDNFLFGFDRDPATSECSATNGDSGSPSFTFYSNTLAVMGTHYTIGFNGGNPATFDTFAPNFIDLLDAELEDDGYSLLVIPEAGTVWVLSAAAAIVFAGRLRRRAKRSA